MVSIPTYGICIRAFVSKKTLNSYKPNNYNSFKLLKKIFDLPRVSKIYTLQCRLSRPYKIGSP